MTTQTVILTSLLLAFISTFALAGGKREKPGDASRFTSVGQPAIHYVVDYLTINTLKDSDGMLVNQAESKKTVLASFLSQKSVPVDEAEYIVHITVHNTYSDTGSQEWGGSANGSGASFNARKLSILTKVSYLVLPGKLATHNFKRFSGNLKTIKSEQQLGQRISTSLQYFIKSRYFDDFSIPSQGEIHQESTSGALTQALMDENYEIFFQEMPDEITHILGV